MPIGPHAHGPSFLRWAGSKRRSLERLALAFRQPSDHYVEPFAGSAALFFHLAPNAGTLADLNGHLINALEVVRQDPVAVYSIVAAIPRTSEEYYRQRERFNKLPADGLESACLFIYLNRNCFNGLWRTNSLGLFNVPFGGSEMAAIPPVTLFEECARTLKTATLAQQDFRVTIANNSKPHTFIYADPPYFHSTQRVFVEYGRASFGEHDLIDLIAGLKDAARAGASVALTYHDGMPLPGIPDDWHRVPFAITRNVGGFSGSRKQQVEVLYTNVGEAAATQ